MTRAVLINGRHGEQLAENRARTSLTLPSVIILSAVCIANGQMHTGTGSALVYNSKANAVLSEFKHISGDLRVTIVQSYCNSF